MIASQSSEDPIFIWAIPRSGGTLLTFMLDSHPQVAMSYEIYDDLLIGIDGAYLTIDQCVGELASSCSSPNAMSPKAVLNGISTPNLRVFVARAMRAGLTFDRVVSAFSNVGREWRSFSELAARQDLIETLMKAKAAEKKASRWGGKTRSNLDDLHVRYPNARFLVMFRDFRDVYSSRKSHGFEHLGDVGTQTQDWVLALRNLENFAAKARAKVMIVDYETLCRRPEWSLKQVCAHVGVGFDESMLKFDPDKHNLLDNSFGHLSADQLRGGLNEQSIGRYTRDLSTKETKQITDMTLGLRPKCFVDLGDENQSLPDC